MRAVVVGAFGDSTVLSEVDRPVPLPLPDEVAIDVAFAGVGFIDTLVRSGNFDFMKPPFVPGIEISGTVRAVGSNVTRFSIGQRVAALLTDFSRGGMGGYAEIACARAALTVPLTPREDLATAAATIANGTAAFLASAKQIDGSDVVISGASGGLGRCLVALRPEMRRIAS